MAFTLFRIRESFAIFFIHLSKPFPPCVRPCIQPRPSRLSKGSVPPNLQFLFCPSWTQRANLYYRLIHLKIHAGKRDWPARVIPWHHNHALPFFARAALLVRALTQAMLHAGCMLALHRYLRRPLHPALAHGSGLGGRAGADWRDEGVGARREMRVRVLFYFQTRL